MPPGPAYNWFCVLYSAAEILSHAARYRAAQVFPRNAAAYANPRKRRRTEEPTEIPVQVVVDDVSIVTGGVYASIHENPPLPSSESSANTVTATATENLQPKSPYEFPDAYHETSEDAITTAATENLKPPKKIHEFPDARPENIEKEPILQQLVRGKIQLRYLVIYFMHSRIQYQFLLKRIPYTFPVISSLPRYLHLA